jgi:hypothetical protein
LKCPKVEAYWAQIEAEQMFHLAFMTRVKCRALSKLAEARKELANHEKTSR